MVLPKFVAAIAAPGVGVGDCLVAGGKLRVLETIEFGIFCESEENLKVFVNHVVVKPGREATGLVGGRFAINSHLSFSHHLEIFFHTLP